MFRLFWSLCRYGKPPVRAGIVDSGSWGTLHNCKVSWNGPGNSPATGKEEAEVWISSRSTGGGGRWRGARLSPSVLPPWPSGFVTWHPRVVAPGGERAPGSSPALGLEAGRLVVLLATLACRWSLGVLPGTSRSQAAHHAVCVIKTETPPFFASV